MKTNRVLFWFGLLGATVRLAVAQPADIRQGLVAYWPLDATDGVITADATPLQNNLTLVAMDPSSFVPGEFGNAGSFNGSSSYLTNLHSSDNAVTGLPVYRAGSYTIAMWVKGAAQTAKYLFTEASTASTAPLLLLQTGQLATNNTKFDVNIRTDGNVTLLNHVVSTNVVFDGNWHHIAWVDDSGQARLYVDGNLDPANFNYTPSGTFTLNTTAIGTLVRATISTGAIFNGLIDDVAVWERPLSQAEVQQVMTSSLATPIPVLPPVFITQPRSSTNALGDRVRLTGRAVGGRPLSYQWYKGDVEVFGAVSNALTLSGLTVADSGDYTLVANASSGSTTSLVATLTVALRPPPPTDLKIDFNNIGAETPADTEAGFLSFALPQNGVGPFTRSFGGADVTLSAIGTTMESRLRTTPSNAVDFTEEKLLRDFIFTRDAADGQGLDVAVQFLEPNQPFTVTVWSFDSSSVGNNRISDWSANGAQVLSAYSFIGSDLPTANDRYRFSFDATSDADGAILVQGRRNSSAAGAINVFLNALQVSKRELRVLRIDVAEFGDLRLTIQALNPAATHRIVEKASLTDADWTEVPGVNFGAPNGNVLQATFAPPVGQTRFYRVVENP